MSTMFELLTRALVPIARTTGADYFASAAETLVDVLGAELAVVAERVAASGRWRPLSAYRGGAWVANELGAPEHLDVLRDRALAMAGADGQWHAIESRRDAEDVVAAVGIVHRGALEDAMRTGLEVMSSRAAAEIARVHAERRERIRTDVQQTQNRAVLELARMPTGPWPKRLQTILQTVSQTLDVERASYWTLGAGGEELICDELFVLSQGTFDRGAVVAVDRFPSYFAMMHSAAVVAVEDVRRDERTKHLAPDPFSLLGVRSTLAVPVWSDGRLAGILALAHVGAPRRWSVDDQRFAASVAETIALALQADARARAEERYRLVSLAIGEVVWEWDIHSGTLEWNENIRNVFGYAGGAASGSIEWWVSRVHTGDRARVERSLKTFFDGGETKWAEEYRFMRADGTVAFVRDRGAVVRGPDRKPLRMIGSMLDITQTKEMEQQLILAERMASMGTLAAGIAHEINNPLAYVKGNVEHVLAELRRVRDLDPDLVAALDEAREGAERVRQIVQELRMFSRPREAGAGPIDVERVIESSLALARNEIRHRARLTKVFRRPPPVDANEGRIGQVVLNLVVNALQAMPEETPEANELRIETGVDDGRVFIEVADNGKGISSDVLGRIFDPFFTTKPVGEGTGLGLAIAHSIVVASGGEITVDSAPGVGSRFRVTLDASSTDVTAPTSRSSAAPPRRFRVLVVDDDARVGAIVRRSLARDHEVTVVTAGREAIDLLVVEDFDVVICDLMMPDVTGVEVFNELSARKPELARRFVFVTGGAFTPRTQEFLTQSAQPVIEKPFGAAELRRVVASLGGTG